MALKPCRECAGEVSTEAPFCPRCGVPSPASAPGAAAPPVDGGPAEWYYIDGDARQGPCTREHLTGLLRQGRLWPETRVKRESMMHWLPAHMVPELEAEARAAPASGRPPPYRAVGRVGAEAPRHAGAGHNRGKKLKFQEAAEDVFPVCPGCAEELTTIWTRSKGWLDRDIIMLCPHCRAFLGYGVYVVG